MGDEVGRYVSGDELRVRLDGDGRRGCGALWEELDFSERKIAASTSQITTAQKIVPISATAKPLVASDSQRSDAVVTFHLD